MTNLLIIKIQPISDNLLGNLNLIRVIVILAGIIFLLTTSGLLVKSIIERAKNKTYQSQVDNDHFNHDTLTGPINPINNKSYRDYTGFIIGKCENILIFTLIILNQYTALALIFTAKTIVRAEAIRQDPLYYLAGTMVNVVYSMVIGILISVIISSGIVQ
jgi:hypothetical protein